jgi:carboxymethylenebutenolidase
MKRIPALLLVLTVSFVGVVFAQQDTGADEEYVESMGREHAGDTPVANQMTEGAAPREVTTKTVEYADLDGKVVAGHLAMPADGEATAAMIVIHEWWGLNDNVRAMAEKLAAEGYAALAIDLYEGGVATDRDGAMALMRTAQENDERLEENLLQARTWLGETLGVEKVGVIGWCFGGGWSLRAGLGLGDAIAATVIYYGRLVTDAAELAPLTSPVLGIFGAEDGGIPVDSVKAFEAAMAEAGKPASIHIYDGADHAFANPSGTRYNAEAAEDAWARTVAFLAENLQ